MLDISIQKSLYGSQGSMTLAIELQIEKGEFIVIMGESGAGKTSLLRILAGLERAKGTITMDNIQWLKNEKLLPAQKRKIGFVFQDYALFENMSVEENLLFVNPDKALAQKMLTLTQLESLASYNVKHLSGGQKQRVGLCRAMMHTPQLLLMDEPLSALDAKMRHILQNEIALFHETFGTTTIMISHDADIAYALADMIIVMEQGKIIKQGSPDAVLSQSLQTVYTL